MMTGWRAVWTGMRGKVNGQRPEPKVAMTHDKDPDEEITNDQDPKPDQ
jgi:hypothetical protein